MSKTALSERSGLNRLSKPDHVSKKLSCAVVFTFLLLGKYPIGNIATWFGFGSFLLIFLFPRILLFNICNSLDKIAMPVEKMASKIAKRILKKKKRSVLGWDAKLMNFTAKIMPVKGIALIAWGMKKSKSKVFKNIFVDEDVAKEKK